MDTLFDLRLTRELLEAYRRVLPAGAAIGTLVNTHADGDHTFGNELVRGRPHRRLAEDGGEEMTEVPPALLAAMMRQTSQMGLARAGYSSSESSAGISTSRASR